VYGVGTGKGKDKGPDQFDWDGEDGGWGKGGGMGGGKGAGKGGRHGDWSGKGGWWGGKGIGSGDWGGKGGGSGDWGGKGGGSGDWGAKGGCQGDWSGKSGRSSADEIAWQAFQEGLAKGKGRGGPAVTGGRHGKGLKGFFWGRNALPPPSAWANYAEVAADEPTPRGDAVWRRWRGGEGMEPPAPHMRDELFSKCMLDAHRASAHRQDRGVSTMCPTTLQRSQLRVCDIVASATTPRRTSDQVGASALTHQSTV
jgi:hypothetical protein